MTLSQFLINYRTEHGLSQRAFAAMCGLSNSNISLIEKTFNAKTGEPIVPTLQSLNKIADAMGITVEELFASCEDMLVDISSPEETKKAAPENQVQPLNLSEAQAELVQMMERLSDEDQQMLLRLARAAFPPKE